MSGIDELNKKLVEMGANKAQLGSKVIPMMLSIFADAENAVNAYAAFEELRRGAEKKSEQAISAYHAYLHEAEDVKSELIKAERERAKFERLQEQLLQFETAEARDRFRLAKAFEVTVRPQNVYQQTEFIKGMAAILSGGKADGQISE